MIAAGVNPRKYQKIPECIEHIYEIITDCQSCSGNNEVVSDFVRKKYFDLYGEERNVHITH